MIKAVAILAVLCVAVAMCGPPPPVWPAKYRVSGTFNIPYWDLSAPFELQFDSGRKAQMLSFFNGLDTQVIDLGSNKYLSIGPQVDRFVCTAAPATGMDMMQVLPDLSTWSFSGMARMNGWLVEEWIKEVRSFGLLQVYAFYVYRDMKTNETKPIQYILRGTDMSLGSGHPDVYEWTFDAWTPGAVDDADFSPALCNNAAEEHHLVHAYRGNSKLLHGVALLGMAGMPTHDDDDLVEGLFQRHVLEHGKPILGHGMYRERLAAFRANAKMVTEHNAKFEAGESSYSLALNHFADLTLAERVMLYSPRAQLKREERMQQHAAAQVSVSGNFTWVPKGVVNPVVDQAACGSCWAFGSIAALEGAIALKSGHLPKLSEQQLVDCAWIGQSMGCGGGFPGDAYAFVSRNGGVASEAAYPYLGQNAMCDNSTREDGTSITGYVNASTVEEALHQLSFGPLAIAIDAAAPPGDFYFYRSGIYDNPQCGSTAEYLDHEVTLVGYGEVNGKMGALLKNSWSTHWGAQGYGMLTLETNMCGWATQARRPTV